MINEPRIVVVEDLTTVAAERIAKAIMTAVEARGRAVLCLSGGSTPLPIFHYLAKRQDLPWQRVHCVWGDERWVPHDHSESNFGAAKRALLDHVPVPAEQVLPWPYGADPRAAAAAFAGTLVARLGAPTAGAPLFDLNLLGLGADAHTASLFPGSGAALRSEIAFALEVPEKGWRLTLSASTLSSSRTSLFAVSGENKRAALAATWPRAWSALAGDSTQSSADASGSDDDAARGSEDAAASLDSYPARALGALEELVVLTDIRP